MTLLERIIEYKNKEPDPIIKEYNEYIWNNDIPLNDRWYVFSVAPDEWKEHDNYIAHFDIEKKCPNWFDGAYRRYQTINLTKVITWLEENLFDEEEWTQELVDEWKKEILLMNLGSFIYDW